MTVSTTESATASAALPIIILRGLSREASHSQRFLEALHVAMQQQHGEWQNCRILCPDLPGTGTRFNEPSPTNINAILDALDLESIAPQFHLVGISLGGMLASALAERTPEIIASLTLVNTSFKRYSAIWQRFKVTRAHRILRALINWPNTEVREQAIMKLVSNHTIYDGFGDQSFHEVLDTWVQIQREHPVSFANVRRQMQAAMNFTGPEKAPCPHIQILVSDTDQLVSPQCSYQLAKAWQVPIHAHPSAGHDLFLDDPEWSATQIGRFVMNRDN